MKELNIIGFGRYYLFEQKTCSIGFWDVAHGEMFLNGKGIVFEADGNIDQGLFSFSLQPEQIQEITDFRQNAPRGNVARGRRGGMLELGVEFD